MAIAIDKFQGRYDRAFEGQLAKGPVYRVLSAINETETPIKFGRFIIAQGTGSGCANCKADTVKGDIIGVTLREVAAENNLEKEAMYHKNQVVNYVTDEIVFVKTHVAAERGGMVYVEVKGSKDPGSVSSAKTSDNIAVDAFFLEDAEANAIVPIKLGAMLG